MSDFIREVDEEVRQDRILRLWNAYWGHGLLVAILILVGVGAWRAYGYFHEQQMEAAATRYLDALQQSSTDPAKATAVLEEIAKDAPAGYRLLARFRAAGELGRTDPAGAAKAFDTIAVDASVPSEFQDIARLRAAILLVDAADRQELQRRLEPQADANAPYRNIARELLALIALKAGDNEAAGRWLDAIVADPAALADIRQRAGLYLGLVRAGTPQPSPQ